MKLRIEKFAKIKEAEIELNGITVIAGYNDTGKSTIGKVLYSIFNSLHSIDKTVRGKRKNDIEDICREITEGVYGDGNIYVLTDEANDEWLEVAEVLADKILEYNEELSIENYRGILREVLSEENKIDKEVEIDDYVESTYSKISAIKNTSDIDLYKEVLDRYFSNVFSTQINNCYFPEKETKINLTLKEKEIKLLFKNNECTQIELPVKILHEAFFIDDPFVMDNVGYRRYARFGLSIRDQLIRRILVQRESLMDGIFDAVVSKETLKEINDVLNRVINGEVRNSKNGMEYISTGHEEAIAVTNLSAGLKGFILIKTLLEKGILKEKDVLILDEPEIHMHTQWQLIYAEMIVLLQKVFDLTILVTTHSSHFLQAIEYFSKKYKLAEKCNYYLSKKDEEGVVFQNVTNDTGKIHSEMVEPSILLDRLEEELEYECEN